MNSDVGSSRNWRCVLYPSGTARGTTISQRGTKSLKDGYTDKKCCYLRLLFSFASIAIGVLVRADAMTELAEPHRQNYASDKDYCTVLAATPTTMIKSALFRSGMSRYMHLSAHGSLQVFVKKKKKESHWANEKSLKTLLHFSVVGKLMFFSFFLVLPLWADSGQSWIWIHWNL